MFSVESDFMNLIRHKCVKITSAVFFAFSALCFGETNTSLLESTSQVNWITKEFKSNISIDVDKAGIAMPSGKTTAINVINTRVPDLIKDPLLTLNVDADRKLGDLILEHQITYHDLTDIITSSSCTMGYFKQDSSTFTRNHTINLPKIYSLFIKHNIPYRLKKPVEFVSSKPYTGIIIDARGKVDVHGEFMKENVEPSFFPRIFTDEMEVIYEKNMVDPSFSKAKGTVRYDYSDDESRYSEHSGTNPLHILAQECYGENRSDLVIKKEDALKILCVPENIDLLKKGKVVILLNKDQLVYNVAAPLKDDAYYTTIGVIKNYPFDRLLGPDGFDDGPIGPRFIYNLKFIPNSPELLPGEKARISECAKLLKEVLKDNAYTIFIGGHTADIGQPQNQMLLSIDRAKAIIDALVQEGLDRNIFSYRGYGETVPAKGGDNSTPEGRALNRRVEITLRPRATYIQRAN